MFKPNFTFRENIWTNFLVFFNSCDSVKNEEMKECFAWERFFDKQQREWQWWIFKSHFNIDTSRRDPSPRIFVSSSWIPVATLHTMIAAIFFSTGKVNLIFLDGCMFVDVFGISTPFLNWIKSCQTRRWQLASQREWKLLVKFSEQSHIATFF